MKWFIPVAILGLWAFYIFLGDTPSTKVYRACHPTYVSFALVSDVAARWDYNAAQHVLNWGEKTTAWCEYSIYRSVYGQRQEYVPSNLNESNNATSR